MCLGVMLCDCSQEMLFYVKCTPVFKAVMFILAFFQSIFSCVFTEHLLGRQPGFILGKKKFFNEVHRMCSPPPRACISLPTPKEPCSLPHLGEVRPCSKLYVFGKGPQGALGVERNQVLCLSKSSTKSIVI